MEGADVVSTVTVFLLLGCFHITSATFEKPCHLSDLQAKEVITCGTTHLSSTIKSGSTCIVQCTPDEQNQHSTCVDGVWTYGCFKLTTKPRRQKRFFVIPVIAFFLCVIFCFRPPRDITPPILHCPSDITKAAQEYQNYAFVYWTEPTAYDNRDGEIRPKRKGRGPRGVFSGRTIISYHARDESRNMATCSFHINIKVIECPTLSSVKNGYFICYPGSDYRYGSRCEFGCYKGHKLVGKSRLRCLKSGRWSGDIPYCKKISCRAPPPSTAPLSHSCSDGNNYRSVCSYICSEGYDIQYGQSRVRICNDGGEWRGSIPQCEDVEPPMIHRCQGAIYTFANKNSTLGTATWSEPYASDNHDSDPRLVKEGDINNGDTVEAGIYHVKYTSRDNAGNKAYPCKMKIVVKVLKCHMVYPTPHLTVACPGGYKYGAMCTFDCNVGSELNGSAVAVCERFQLQVYAEWSFGMKQPHCDVFERCKTTPNVPRNGALACDNWLGGKFCQLLCKKGYDLKPGFPFFEMFVCGVEGEWQPSNLLPLPDCTRTYSTSFVKLRMSANYYFAGNCTDPAVQNEIKTNFISIFSSSVYRDACLTYAKRCAAENVQVLCGQSKRSAEMKVNFEIVLTLDESDFAGSLSNARSGVDDLSHATWNVLVNESSFILANSTIEMKPLDLSTGDLELYCQNNTIPSYPTLSCVNCGPGTYFYRENKTCIQCPRGTYSPEEGMSDCLQCPVEQNTFSIGSVSIDDCQDACPPGSRSQNGLPPCSLCPVGTYSDTYSTEVCAACTGSKSTIGEGTKNASECQEFDLVFTNITSLISSKIKKTGNSDSTTISFWTILEGNLTVCISSENHPLFELTIGEWVSLESENLAHTLNKTLADSRWHFLRVDIEQGTTRLSVDGEVVLNESTTDSLLQDLDQCEVFIKGMGTLSQFNIWSQLPYTNGSNNFEPKCFGDEVGDIFTWKQFENESGEDVFLQIPSECDDFDDCASSPCQNGVCTDEGVTYSCSCYDGFFGGNCETNADDCVENVCENNSTCVDGVAGYTCACAEEYTGELCETLMIDGGWSNWTEWSSCSRTCENGTMQRTRRCNNPTPDNGGKTCNGSSTEIIPCVEQEICPFCSNITAPDNSTLDCISDNKGSINCTLECDPGFDFDHTPKPFYFCGPDTFFMWDFQSDDNVYKRLPFCSEVVTTDKLSASYSARYMNLSLVSNEVHEVVLTKVQTQVDRITCKQSGECTVRDVRVTRVEAVGEEMQRTEFAGFRVIFDCDAKSQSTETCYVALNTAVFEITEMASNASLSVMLGTDIYDISLNDTSAQGIIDCPSGYVEVKYYCVPCAVGNFMRSGECVTCPIGTYQDETGQSSCKECSEGMTTLGQGSISSSDCVAIRGFTKEDPVDAELIIGVTTGFVVIALVVTAVVKRKKMMTGSVRMRSKGKNEYGGIVTHISQTLEMAGVWKPLTSKSDSSTK